MKKSDKKIIHTAALTGALILTLAAWILAFLAIWVFMTWHGLRMDEIMFQLRAPLEGTGDGIIIRGVLSSVLPALLITAAVGAAYYFGQKRGKGNIVLACSTVISVAVIAASLSQTWKRLDLQEYFRNQADESTFIEDNYVDPAKVSVTFPGKKRNLIYIYLESMEMTFADTLSGGAFNYNVIPELTELSAEGECFDGGKGTLNGGRVLPGTTFTMGGMFAQSAGLPLKIDLGEDFADKRGTFNKMNTQDAFFEKVTSLGDILQKEGYNNVLMLGSNATFGGRRLYFSTHGDYKIDDYNWAVEEGIIPPDYYVFWGMEDEKLFDAARDELSQLAESGEPFNLTMLTVDTHFEDGYTCRLCRDQYPGNDYANVMACSSRQVTEFVRWIQQQDFYENTTIVLCGDHTTMDSDFCKNVPDTYQRKVYTNIINAAASCEDPAAYRDYTTLDLFPTTLAALGCGIEGNRLGLGTNLYSSEKTLAEKYGFDETFSEMEKKSGFMIELADIDIYDKELLQAQGKLPKAVITMTGMDPGRESMSFMVSDIENIPEEYQKVELRAGDRDGKGSVTIRAQETEEGIYMAEADLSGFHYKNASLTAVVTGKSGRLYDAATMTGDLTLKQTDIYSYLDALIDNPQYTVLIALRDDGSHSLNREICDRLKKLGLKKEIPGHYRWSYYAVVSPEGVTEELSEKELSCTGTLADGADYSMISQGGLSGAGGGAGRYLRASVKIRGVEYAVNRIGLNFVVYDTENSCVVDSCEFNTYMGLDPKRIDVADLEREAENEQEQMNIGTDQ